MRKAHNNPRAGRVSSLGLALLLALFVVSSASAQTIEDALRFSSRQPMTGVRSLGMAGAGAAGIADYSAMFSNPAGLGYFRSSGFSGSLSFFSTEDQGRFTGPSTNALDNRINDTQLGHLAYVHKVRTRQGSLVFGAAINQIESFSRELYYSGDNGDNSVTDFFLPVAGEYSVDTNDGEDGIPNTADDEFIPVFDRDLSFIAFELFAIDFDVDAFEAGNNPFFPAVSTGTVEQTGTIREEGAMHEINLGVAAEAAERVMVGASLNIPVGKWTLDRFQTEDDVNNANDGAGGTTDFASLDWTQTIESNLVGVNVRAGVSVSTPSGFRAGASIETPTYYEISEDYSTIMTVRFDDGFRDSYGDDFSEDVGAGSFDYNLITPWRLGLGVGYSKRDLRVMVDAEVIDWSQMELDSDLVSFAEENRFIAQNLEDAVNVRAGIEYDFGPLTVRGGVASISDPRKTSYGRLDSGDDRSRAFVGVGLSYRAADRFVFDVAWSGEQFYDEFVTYGVEGAPLVSEEVLRGRFAIGIRAKL
ncbi:MAG: hypothetical protein HKN13_13800 [Rhodothermales bacterium]|nr:hypothetical protein [Rhodothermales bacterium]